MLLIHIGVQLLQSLLLVLVAPLLLGWINQCRAWLANKSGAGLLQPYRNLHKLLCKDVVVAHHASLLFRAVPYIRFGCMWLVVAIIPALTTMLPFASAADVIALVGIFALARVFLALAAMDIGTAFGSMGARREMMIAFLAEPALLMIFFNASLISHSTSLATIVTTLSNNNIVIYPGLAFAAASFVMVLLAENARIPVDNPATHLELTMVHEAMILEYSGRHLALIEWASSIKLLAYMSIGIALFIPWGIAQDAHGIALIIAIIVLMMKLLSAGLGLAVLETVTAKMRIFRAPEFLGTAFLLAILGILTHLLLWK